MKKLLVTCLCFSINLAQSQIKNEISLYKGENIYIEVPFNAKYQTLDKNTIIESYLIEIGSSCEDKKNIKFEVLSDGKLSKNISLTGKSLPTIKVTYTNKDGNNKVVKINKSNVENFISYEELKSSSLNNLLWVISQFKNVYILNNKNEAKKVQIEQLPSL